MVKQAMLSLLVLSPRLIGAVPPDGPDATDFNHYSLEGADKLLIGVCVFAGVLIFAIVVCGVAYCCDQNKQKILGCGRSLLGWMRQGSSSQSSLVDETSPLSGQIESGRSSPASDSSTIKPLPSPPF